MQARILDGDNGKVRVTSDLQDITAAIKNGTSIWVDLEKHESVCDQFLAEVMKVHPLTIEDIWSEVQSPKIEDYDGYLYIVLHGVAAGKKDKLTTVELDVVMGKTFVITHDPRDIVTSELKVEIDRSARLLAKGPAWFAHAALDRAVDHYMPVVDKLDAAIEQLQDDVLDKAGTKGGTHLMTRILEFKRILQSLRRTGIHQRETLLRLSRGEFDEIPAEALPFYRDIYDHFTRINDITDSYRDLVTSALDAYLSVQSNRMNEIMKTLTLMSTVMLPLTFIAGVYGMNFANMPELKWEYGYPLALALMAGTAAAILTWFRRRGWLGRN